MTWALWGLVAVLIIVVAIAERMARGNITPVIEIDDEDKSA